VQKLNNITASIVLFEENIHELSSAVNSFLKTPLSKKLFLIDNSPSEELKDKFTHPDIEYIFTGKNLGFAAGHNLVIEKIKNDSKYHLVLNPDVSFEPEVIPNLLREMEKNKDLSLIAPKVLFPNGEHQFSCRRYPSLFELLVRRTSLLKNMFSSIIKRGEYYDKNLTIAFYPEFIHGCFHLFKTEDFVRVKGFDERYFLYMEDVDICRKIDAIGKKKMYYPGEEISHILKKGSSKNIKLLVRHFLSGIQYFYKWR
jgi:GT2 family glycosyltransferase